MAEDDVRVFLGHGLTGVHVAPGGGEDDVAAFLHQLGQSVLHSGGVGVGHVDLLHQLILRQADVLHHALDALLMGVAVAGALSGVGQVHNAHLDVFLGDAGAGGLTGGGGAAGSSGGSSAAGSGAAAAGGQAYGHHSGQRKAQNLLHVKNPPYMVVSFVPFQKNAASRRPGRLLPQARFFEYVTHCSRSFSRFQHFSPCRSHLRQDTRRPFPFARSFCLLRQCKNPANRPEMRVYGVFENFKSITFNFRSWTFVQALPARQNGLSG